MISFLPTSCNLRYWQKPRARKRGRVTLRIQPGYDHSYYFIASFIEDHLRFHAQYLLK